MNTEKNHSFHYYRKLSIKCIVLSILGTIVLFLSNYRIDTGQIIMPVLVFQSMLAAGGVILLIGIVGLVVTTVRSNRKQ